MKPWSMKTADGHLVVDNGTELVLVERDPTPKEAGAAIEARVKQLLHFGEAASASDALRIALRENPLFAKVWSGS